MTLAHRARRGLRGVIGGASLLAAAVLLAGAAQAQDDDSYILGLDNRLQMQVHILGEVQNPGEYMVPDDTNILELLSKAGGPTEFASLDNVLLKRAAQTPDYLKERGDFGERVSKINLEDYLKKSKSMRLPVLQPGDVVTVSRNGMHKWKTVFGMARDLSVVASAYFLYVRATKP